MTSRKKRSKNLWVWFVDTCKGKTKLSKKSRMRLSGVAGLASFILTVLVFTRVHRETTVQFERTSARTEAIQAMLDSQDFGYAIMDQEGKVIEWNPALERLTHWTEKEVKEKGLGIVMSNEALFNKHLKAVSKVFGADFIGGHVSVINCIMTPHGEEDKPLPVRITVRMVQSQKGKRFAIAHVDPTNVVKEINVK